ncbi:MAG: GAF domain-containing protein [Armatimonadota bacterium]
MDMSPDITEGRLPVAPRLFTERIGRLNKFSWALNGLRDQQSIMHSALGEAPLLVGADTSAIWLWDADLQVPVVLVTAERKTTDFPMPPTLLALFRQTCDKSCSFSIDAGETESTWPSMMVNRSTAFIPLPTQQGCLGVLTVHHAAHGHFSNDDILLLSSLGNLIATALLNVQLHASERHLVSLLQSSIRQVMQATSKSAPAQYDEFILSLLQVAEGLTHAAAACARLDIADQPESLTVISGTLADCCRNALVDLGPRLQEQMGIDPAALRGSLQGVIAPAGEEAERLSPFYALAPIVLDGKPAGIVYALSETLFADDQLAFLQTMAEQIGMGVESIRQAADIQRLLFSLANVNYVSSAITSTFDPKRIFSIISQAASQALSAPIAFCGWRGDDGAIRVVPGTAVGLGPEMDRHLVFPENSAVMQALLQEKRGVVDRRILGARARTAFPMLKRLGVRDWVGVPMMVKSHPRGVMVVADMVEREFNSREIALLSTYANQGGLAMENSLLYEQVQQQLQQMELLYDFTRSVSATLDPHEVYQKLLEAATGVLNVPVAFISLAEHGTTVQTIKVALGTQHPDWYQLQFPSGEGIIGTVGQRRVPLVSTNLMRDGRCTPELRNLARDEGLISSLTVPLIIQDEAPGALTAIAREGREYTLADQQLLQAMAAAAAVALQNARRYQEEQQRSIRIIRQLANARERMITLLDLVGELVDLARQDAEASDGLQRTRWRMEGLLAAVHAMGDEHPEVIDVKDALTLLVKRRFQHDDAGHVPPQIQISGAHFDLPFRNALLLVVFVREWLHSAVHQAGADTSPITVALQKIGREVIVDIEGTGDWTTGSFSVNRAIIAFATQELQAKPTERRDGDSQLIRLRFVGFGGDSGSR